MIRSVKKDMEAFLMQIPFPFLIQRQSKNAKSNIGISTLHKVLKNKACLQKYKIQSLVSLWLSYNMPTAHNNYNAYCNLSLGYFVYERKGDAY